MRTDAAWDEDREAAHADRDWWSIHDDQVDEQQMTIEEVL